MSKRLFIYTFFFVFLSSPVWAVLTNESILKMIDAGLEESIILSVIEKDEGRYDLSVDGLIALKEAGVSETLIQAMLAASSDEATTASSSSMQTADDFQESSENRAEISIVPPFISPQAGNEYYTRYTFYYEREVFRSTNYRRGIMVPINTKVKLVSLGAEEFLLEVKGQMIKVRNIQKYSGCSSEEFASKMLSSVPTNIDVFGKRLAADIKSGTLRLGMNKEQAIMARGYPPVHETPSIEMDRWVYWSSRFVKRTIVFYDGILSEGRGLN